MICRSHPGWLGASHPVTHPHGAHGAQVLTGHVEDVGDPLVLEQPRVGHHAGQRLPIHAAAGHQMEL